MPDEATILGIVFVQGLMVFTYWLSCTHGTTSVHHLRRLPRRTVAELVAGKPARLQGKTEREGDRPLLRAPLSGRPCLAYCVRVSRHVHSRDMGKAGWRTVINDFAMQSFWVRDTTGRILVVLDREQPELTMSPARVADERAFKALQEYLWKQPSFLEIRSLLPRLDAGEHVDGDRREAELRAVLPELRVEEGVLLESGRVAVGGCPITDTASTAASESGYREQRGSLVFEGLDGGAVVVTNQPIAMR